MGVVPPTMPIKPKALLPEDFFLELGYTGRRKIAEGIKHQPSSGKKKKMTKLDAKYYRIMREYNKQLTGHWISAGIINPILQLVLGWNLDDIRQKGEIYSHLNRVKYAPQPLGELSLDPDIFDLILTGSKFEVKNEKIYMALYCVDIPDYPGISLAKLGIPKLLEIGMPNEYAQEIKQDVLNLNLVFKYGTNHFNKHYEGLIIPMTREDNRIPEQTKHIYGHIFSYVVKPETISSISYCDIKYYGLYNSYKLLKEGLERAITDHGGKTNNEKDYY